MAALPPGILLRLRERRLRHRSETQRPAPVFSLAAMRAIERVGFEGAGWRDVYHGLITISPAALLGVIAVFYIVANLIFALVYLLFGSGISGARHGSFADAFFFSIQTMSTIGYGQLSPVGLASNLIVAAEAVFGLLLTALSTGVLFARLSRPTARVRFSRVAVISSYEGVPTLMFRVANRRRNQIVEAHMTLTTLRNEASTDGHSMRRFYDMRLLRSRSPVFGLTWTVMHPIDPDSPLYGCSHEDMLDGEVYIVCALTGIDDTYSQTIHDRYVYTADDLRWNAKFVDVFGTRPDGRRFVDYTRFNDVID